MKKDRTLELPWEKCKISMVKVVEISLVCDELS
jgi:hypothetical protein